MEAKVLKNIQKHWDALLNEGQALKFHKGQSLYYEGHNPYGIFVLTTGNVRFDSKQHCTGEHFWDAPAGKVLGLKSFLEDCSYCCDCIAREDCDVVFISKTQLSPYRL